MRPGTSATRKRLAALKIVGLLVAPAVALALAVIFWEWLSGGESGSTTVRNLALVVAGLVALWLARWRSVVADRQADTAHQSLLNERYQKAAEMLGSAVLSVRLAGIYALQRLAKEQPEQYHIQVMRLFCAFVRLPTEDQILKSGQAPIRQGSLLGIRQDVESVMDAIGFRGGERIAIERRDDFKLDLRGADLSEAQILDANLSKAWFHHANLSRLRFVETNLTDAMLVGADLSKATFFEVNFTGTTLRSADLSGAMLQGAEMPGMHFDDTSLCGANLTWANLAEATFQSAKATRVVLERAKLPGALFFQADLSRSLLAGADLAGARFYETDLTGANLAGANLSGAVFSFDGQQPVQGLSQSQLDQAMADPDNPPELLNVLDAQTDEPLVWRGKPLE